MFARCLSIEGQGMKNAKVLQNCKQGDEQGSFQGKFQGKFHMGAYLNMFHAVTCQKQNEITRFFPRSECQKFGVLETVAMAMVRLLLKSIIMSYFSGVSQHCKERFSM